MKIKSYKVIQFAGGTSYPKTAIILLFDENNTKVAHLMFFKNQSDVGRYDSREPRLIICNYAPERYTEVLDLLRNEGPVHLYFDDSLRVGYLSTDSEPVGEGELA